MADVIQILAAFGVGTIVATVLQYFFNERAKRKTVAFQEKKDAFIGLLEAYHKAAVEPSDKHSKDFAYWQMRCELVGRDETIEAIQGIVDSNDNKISRNEFHEKLKRTMRSELKKFF